MSKIKIQVNVDLSVIKSQLQKDEKFLQGIRLHAVYQIALGRDAKDLGTFYSSSPSQYTTAFTATMQKASKVFEA